MKPYELDGINLLFNHLHGALINAAREDRELESLASRLDALHHDFVDYVIAHDSDGA